MNRWTLVPSRFWTRKCNPAECRLVEPHNAHLTWLGRWVFAGKKGKS